MYLIQEENIISLLLQNINCFELSFKMGAGSFYILQVYFFFVVFYLFIYFLILFYF